MLEIIFEIAIDRYGYGIKQARAQAEYDTWFRWWRLLVPGRLIDGIMPTAEQMRQAVILCSLNGWIIKSIVDPANRPVSWASPDFPTADTDEWLPISAQ